MIGLVGYRRKIRKVKIVMFDNGGRRSESDRREFSYAVCLPERRSDNDRRCMPDRRNGLDRRRDGFRAIVGLDRRVGFRNIRLNQYAYN